MTRPNRDNRRLGFTIDELGHSVSNGRDGVWSYSVVRFARWTYLWELARVSDGRVLADLATIGIHDHARLAEWQMRWNLRSSDPSDDWTGAHARGTLDIWERYPRCERVWCDRDDLSGVLVEDDPPTSSRPLKDAQHFEWLAKFQTGAGWAAIAAGPPRADLKTVREAVATLAGAIGLMLRATQRGRPKQ